MRILFFSHYFPPEVNAPASRTYEHAIRWVRAGHEVTVITCVPNCPDGVVYSGYKNRVLPQYEVLNGIRIRRVWTYIAANEGTSRRIANYVSYMVSAACGASTVDRPDVVVATTPQFFCAWAGSIVAKLRRLPFVLEVRDIWPESIAAVGAIQGRRLYRILESLERRLYQSADHIVTVGDGYRDNILSKVDVHDRISVITNGVDLHHFAPGADSVAWRKRWNLEGKFVCSYVGTIGMAHGLDIISRAARRLRAAGRRDIAFCLIGDGAARKSLEDEVQRDQLSEWVRFTGRLAKEEMPAVYAAADACLVHLRKCELFETVIPSKIFEVMALERPIIMGVNGPARDMVAQANCGINITPESDEELFHCVCSLADDPLHRRRIGAQARSYVAQNFNRETLAMRYLGLLAQVAGAGRSARAKRRIVPQFSRPMTATTGASGARPGHSSSDKVAADVLESLRS